MITQLNRLRARPGKSEYQLGLLHQYPGRPMALIPSLPTLPNTEKKLRICLVTPSYQQGEYLERTLQSVLDQEYPNLSYGIQDGNSNDGSKSILERYRNRVAFADSSPDKGQTDAILKGFLKLDPGPDDIMAWVNSDDLYLPGLLDTINHFFLNHPDIDVVYGHRIIIDPSDQEVGRWYLPDHDPEVLKRVDFVPQETLFFRASAYQKAGGLDPTFHFAMDWDLLLRFQETGCRFQRWPFFMGCFRVHEKQKTNTHIHTLGEEEMKRLRSRSLKRTYRTSEIEKIFWLEVLKSRAAANRFHKYNRH